MKRQLGILLALAVLLAGCVPFAPALPPGLLDKLLPNVPGVQNPNTAGLARAAALGVPMDVVRQVGDLEPNDLLPADPNIRIGTLDNGLRYYIRHNAEPQDRAELRLAVNAGSLMEADDQSGLAHFLEHMMFNGTEDFAGQEIINFLERIGMEFGPDVNAYTSFDETVYMLRLPTDDPATVDTAFHVLQQWATAVTLDPAEVDAERGVVVEEWRQRDQNASGRIQNQVIETLLGGSLYADRFPIGDMEIVRGAPTDRLRSFYETWYRPDLMAVVAVGDFDVDEVEGMIRQHFGSLPAAEDPAPREYVEGPSFDEPRFRVIADPEFPYTQVQLFYLHPSSPLDTLDQYRTMLQASLFSSMLASRLDEAGRAADAPFSQAFPFSDNLVRNVELYGMVALVESDAPRALEAMARELERVRRFGFTETELDRARTEIMLRYEKLFTERDTQDSGGFADEYVRNFLENEAIPGIVAETAIAERLLGEITLDEVNAVVEKFGGPRMAVIVTAPEQAGVALPTEEELAATLEKALGGEMEAYVDTAIEGDLMDEAPSPADITDTTEDSALGTTTITLENGVRVVMKPTDFRADEVLFRALSPGGASLVSDEDYYEAIYAPQIVVDSGLGDFSYAELRRILADEAVRVSPLIDDEFEGFIGSASPGDLEVLFQLIHLYATAPHFDAEAISRAQSQARAELRNRELDPFSAMEDAFSRILFGNSIRYGVQRLAEVEALDSERMAEIYAERFSDFCDFTFVFVGAFDVDELTELAQSYLGTLPGECRTETWEDKLPAFPEETVVEEIFKGRDPSSLAQIVFTGPIAASTESEVSIELLQGVLDIVMREELREARGATYSPFVSGSVQSIPRDQYFFVLGFNTDPERTAELIDATFAKLEELQSEGPSDDNLAKAKEQARRAHEEELRTNSYWAMLLGNAITDPEFDLDSALKYDEVVDAITAEDIRRTAEELLRDDRYVEIVLYPTDFKPAE